LEGDLHDAHPDGLVGHDRLFLLPHLRRVERRQQVQLPPPALERGGADVHLLTDLGGRTASGVLLDGPNPGLLRVVHMSHLGGVLVFLSWVVNTPPESYTPLDQQTMTTPHSARTASRHVKLA
jgi:hypothetical protein